MHLRSIQMIRAKSLSGFMARTCGNGDIRGW